MLQSSRLQMQSVVFAGEEDEEEGAGLVSILLALILRMGSFHVVNQVQIHPRGSMPGKVYRELFINTRA